MIDSNEYNSNRTTGDDQQQQHDGRRHRSMNKTDFRFLIPSRDAGGKSNELFSIVNDFLRRSIQAIIGKGGKIIQDLRLKHHCQIQMADCEVPERVLIINGDQNDVLNCISDILSCILENHQRANKPDQNEIRALIHQSQAGALIGKRKIDLYEELGNSSGMFFRQRCIKNQRISREM